MSLSGATLAFDLDGTLVETAPDLIGALNIVLGVYFVPDDATPWRHRVQQLGSALILAAPLLLLAAFFREPWLQNFERPLTRPAVYAVFAGTLLHLISSARTGKR